MNVLLDKEYLTFKHHVHCAEIAQEEAAKAAKDVPRFLKKIN